MRPHRFRLSLLIVLLSLLIAPVSAGDDEAGRTTIAVTATLPGSATDAMQQQVAGFLELLDVALSEGPDLQVVERRQLDQIAAEMVLSGQAGHPSSNRLLTGRITTADLIVLSRIDQDEPDQRGMSATAPRLIVRVVETRTGVIKGITTTTLTGFDPAEAATQVARDLRAIVSQPSRPVMTVAVLPFESDGRFDRLRFFETTVRDLIGARLLEWSHPAVDAKDSKPADRVPQAGPRLQVLQRSSLQDLLREMELLQSGFADADHQSETLPNRAATSFIRGRINERSAGQDATGEVFVVRVSGEVVQAASGKTLHRFELEAVPRELPARLRMAVDQLVLKLPVRESGLPGLSLPPSIKAINARRHETEALFEQVRFDLRRFRRICPIDYSHWVPLAFDRMQRPLPLVPAESPAGRHLLRKSIDRLESLLFIEPDRADAMLALGFCRSLHVEGIQDLKRADELLRRAISTERDSQTQITAIRLLAECGFHHVSGQPAAGFEEQTARQVLDAFRLMPEPQRDQIWARLPGLLTSLPMKPDSPDRLVEALALTVDAAEREQLMAQQYQLAMIAIRLANGLRSTTRRDIGLGQLSRWSDSEKPLLSSVARRGLAQQAEAERNYDRAAEWYLRAAEAWPQETDRSFGSSASLRDNLRIHAGRTLRLAGRMEESFRLLSAIEPDPESLNRGYHAQELGHCLTEMGDDRRALDLLVTTAEQVPSIVDNSSIVERIQKLGGVPLRDERTIHVRYLPGPDRARWLGRIVATDGNVLFCAGGFSGPAGRGVHVVDLRNETWSVLSNEFGRVTCLALDAGRLWVGTDGDGLWRCDLADRRWTQWTLPRGLPDARISALALHEGTVFAGTGTPAAGGIIRLDPDGRLIVLDQEHAPRTAPTHLIVKGHELLASTGTAILSLDIKSDQWTERMTGNQLRLFMTPSGVLASTPGRELFLLDEPDSLPYRAAWSAPDETRRRYEVHGVIDWQGSLWLTGTPWQRFASAGLYRLDSQAGQFEKFGPRDGFQVSTTYETYSAAAIGKNLWLATSAGLAVVELRESAESDRSQIPAGSPAQ